MKGVRSKWPKQRKEAMRIDMSRKRTRAFVLSLFGSALLHCLVISGYLAFRSETPRWINDAPYAEVSGVKISKGRENHLVDLFRFNGPSSPPLAMFYNVFIPSEDRQVRNALRIVKEQIKMVGDSYLVKSTVSKNQTLLLYYNTVGRRDSLNATWMSKLCSANNLHCVRMQHYDQANEEFTLHRVQEYCGAHESHKVVYIHAKGTFHPTRRNEGWRRHLTQAVTDEQCLNPTIDTICNVCGLMFTPLPGNMFRGNFWVAYCGYVNKLVSPIRLEGRLRSLQQVAREMRDRNQLLMNLQPDEDMDYGLGRYASEHWIGSHPSFVPCDLTVSPNIQYWHSGHKSGEFNWSLAPVEPLQGKWSDQPWKMVKYVSKRKHKSQREFFLLPGRVMRWFDQYGQVPSHSSWVWKWFPDGKMWRNAIVEHGVRAVDVVTKQHSLTNTSKLKEEK